MLHLARNCAGSQEDLQSPARLRCQSEGIEPLLLSQKAEGINTGSPTSAGVHPQCSWAPVRLCLTLNRGSSFLPQDKSVLLAFINQVLSIVSYPTFISPALKGWMDEDASGSLLSCDLGEYV